MRSFQTLLWHVGLAFPASALSGRSTARSVNGSMIAARAFEPLEIDGQSVAIIRKLDHDTDYGPAFLGEIPPGTPWTPANLRSTPTTVKECILGIGGDGDAIEACQNDAKAMQKLHDVAPRGIPKLFGQQTTTANSLVVFRSASQFPKGPRFEDEMLNYHETVHLDSKRRAIIGMWYTLREMHHARWAHRDLRPENLVFARARDRHGDDFGLVKFVNFMEATQASKVSTPLRHASDMPFWTSPEEEALRSSDKTVEPDPKASDVWALAALSFVMYTGQIPTFWAPEYRKKDRAGKIRWMQRYVKMENRKIPFAWCDIIVDATAEDQKDRANAASIYAKLSALEIDDWEVYEA